MEQYLNIKDSLYISPTKFLTSLDIIQKVMNVPMCALTSLLRVNGCGEIDKTSSCCIEEDKLDIFAKAYIRKMRSYFFSTLRNISSLNAKELSNFDQFVKLFKNKDNKSNAPLKWSNIDEKLLHETFIQRVKNETEKYCAHLLSKERSILYRLAEALLSESCEYFQIDTNIFQKVICVDSSSSPDNLTHPTREEEKINISEQITHDGHYLSSDHFKPEYWPKCQFIRQVFLCARYYIYSHNDDDHNGFIIKGLNNISFNKSVLSGNSVSFLL